MFFLYKLSVVLVGSFKGLKTLCCWWNSNSNPSIGIMNVKLLHHAHGGSIGSNFNTYISMKRFYAYLPIPKFSYLIVLIINYSKYYYYYYIMVVVEVAVLFFDQSNGSLSCHLSSSSVVTAYARCVDLTNKVWSHDNKAFTSDDKF